MSAALMLRSLVRPSAAAATVPRAAWTATQTSSFSTSHAALAKPDNSKQGRKVASQNQGRGGAASPKKPAAGERKALRKRIQLSNSNALPVPGLEDARKNDLAKPENIGLVLSISGQVQDQLRAVEAFKATQFWHLFRNASTLVRAETVDMVQRMEAAAANKQTLRLVYDGPKISGKSLMLLQGMTHGFLNDWIVINVPEGQYRPLSPHHLHPD
jgi:small subunit ribosomal protein S29